MAVGWRANYLRYKSFFLNVVGSYQKKNDLKMFMELLLSLGAITIFGIFAIRPTLITIAELYKETQAKKQIISTMDAKIENLNEAQRTYEREKDAIALLKIAIPKNGEPDVYARQVEGVASQNPVQVLTFSMGEVGLAGPAISAPASTSDEVMPEGASGLSFAINSSSDYPLLTSFIQGLENLRRPFKLDTIFISTSETEEKKELILVINARTPYLKGDE